MKAPTMNNDQPKIVLITGASSGIGEATARTLATAGATVILGARQGTSHFENHAGAKDASIVAAYHRLRPDFDQYGPGLENLFEGREQPPQAVADEVSRVLAIPRGQKPLRTEVDFSEWGAGVCNAVAEYETTRLWRNMGLGHLLHVSLEGNGSEART